jgi:hypothetical protein
MQDVLASPVTISIPQTNQFVNTQVAAGNFGSGPTTLLAEAYQSNSATVG